MLHDALEILSTSNIDGDNKLLWFNYAIVNPKEVSDERGFLEAIELQAHTCVINLDL